MQESSRIGNTEARRQAAISWIGNLLETIAKGLSVRIASCKWQIDGTGSDTTTYQLVVTGTHDRRMIKLFTSKELDRCLDDKELQSEIQARLASLVAFLGASGSRKRKTRS